ncbi:RNA polymerase sigma-70 factor [uncultured Wocania sp.]|uniref:RNA polymerase sigma factor n=1 Tax=uncultured Wocania sp. TaxID=2834404 RepID=UPI0030F5ECEA
MGDKTLIFAIKKDDAKAFKVLFDKYYNTLVAYVKTFTKDKQSSEDIVQQVFVELWLKRHQLNISISVKGYLFTVAYRTYIDSIRSIKRRDNLLDDLKEKLLRESIIEDENTKNRRLNKLRFIINSLPPKCRKILELNKFHGLKYSEIAEKLDISNKTVESQMRIAYKKIREGFKNDNMFFLFVGGFYKSLKRLNNI